MSRFITILAIIAAVTISVRGDDKSGFLIRYLSADHVYINAGSEDGLLAGDSVTVKRDGKELTRLAVVYVSAHSASCAIADGSIQLLAGDAIEFTRRKAPSEAVDTSYVEEREIPEPVAEEAEATGNIGKRHSRLKGRISASYYRWDDRESSNLDFTQPGLRLNFSIDQLWGTGLSVRMRARTRQNRRVKGYSSDVEQSSWRNTVYEFSIGAGEDDQSGYRFGRIIPRRISGIGYIDGAIAQKRLTGSFMAGGFAGTQPQWQYASFQSTLQKYGVYFTFEGGNRKGPNFESTVALAGEYHGKTVSREYIHLKNTFSNGNGVRLYQSADIDVNRAWRQSKSDNTLALTNLYFSGRFGLSKRIRLGFNLDNRKRYWSYDFISVADSLFDDQVRRGAQLTAEFFLPLQLNAGGSLGLRGRENIDKISRTFTVNLNKRNFTPLRVNLNFGATGFANEFSDGFNVTYGLGKYFRRGDFLAINYSIYGYKYAISGLRRSSRAILARGNNLISRWLSASWEIRSNSGDDIDGLSYYLELGYRLK